MILLPISTMETYPAWLLRHLNHQAEGPSRRRGGSTARRPQRARFVERRGGAPRGAAWRRVEVGDEKCWEMLGDAENYGDFVDDFVVDFRIFY